MTETKLTPAQNATEWNRIRDGFTESELRAAFTLVQNPTDYRGPIKAHVAPDFVRVTLRAILYFTSIEATVTECHLDGRIVIEAPGYYPAHTYH